MTPIVRLNGNLATKADARSITTTYTYDYLNRVTDRDYSDSTPDVDYIYDAQTHAKGKLTQVASSVSTTEYTAFDILGRVTGHKQTTDGNDYTTGYTYNLSGTLDEQTYPSGRVVKNALDASGDLASVTSKENSSAIFKTYVNDFTYNAVGAVSSMKLGNGRFESTTFNSRLQPTQIGLGTSETTQNLLKLEYGYGTTANNGNVQSQTIRVPGMSHPLVQNYTYDSLNRFESATETSNSSQTWKQEFSYDRYGNRSFVTGSGHTTTLGSCTTMCNPTFSGTTNRITSSGYSYDSNGSTTVDPSGRSFIYDGENKQVSVSNGGGPIGQYYYDGDGKRVKKVVPSTGETTIFVYDALGKQIAEYSTIVTDASTAKVAYLSNDHLGSPRINADVAGTVTARHDYYPFGDEIPATGNRAANGYNDDTIRKQFTGYERDNETDLDFAQARMYNNSLGRFSTEDPSNKGINTEIPQSWNRYIYALNNPMQYVDKNGKWPTQTHMDFINEAFSGLSTGEKADIIRGSNEVDTYFGSGHWHDIPTTLLISNAYKHAMTPDGMPSSDAQNMADQWVENRLNAAISADAYRLGLIEFGKGMHTLMDNTSPAHSGFQLYAYPNSGNSILNAYLFIAEGLEHEEKEKRAPTDEERKQTVLTLRVHFLATYGRRTFERAVTNKEARKGVYDYMKARNLRYTEGRPSRVNIVNKNRKKKTDENPSK